MEDALKKLKKIISEKTGVNPKDIKPETFIEEDLNIGELELIEVLTELEEDLEIDLVDYKDDMETIQDILDILEEESDL